jgi:hypothetical protein
MRLRPVDPPPHLSGIFSRTTKKRLKKSSKTYLSVLGSIKNSDRYSKGGGAIMQKFLNCVKREK